MEDYYEYLDSNGVTTLYKLIKDDTVALIDSYSVTLNGITTNLDNHVNNTDIHTPISDIEGMIDIRISGLVNSAPETLDTLKELSDALGNDPNFATTIATQIGSKANSVHNHVVSDITDFPAIPTKLSQLENDMGFGTGGGSSDTSDCVHKTGNETIAGTKTFTDKIVSNKELHYTDTKYDWSDASINTWCDSGNIVWFDKTGNRRMHELVGAQSGVWRKACYINENQYFSVDSNRNISYWGTATFNGHTIFTQDMIFKNNNIDLTVTPSSTLYSNFIFTDKNNQILSYIQYAKRNEEPDMLGLYVNDSNKGLHGILITSNNYLLPMGNNIWNLGSPNNKWQNAHITYTYTNRVTTYSIVHPTDDSYFFVSGGTDYNKGATLYLGGVSATNFTPGRFVLSARKTDGSSIELAGSPDGTLSWGGKNIGIDDNLVHRSGAETINGAKTFTNDIFYKNSNLDLTVTPTSNTYANFIFRDKNNKTLGYLQYGKQTSGNGVIGIYLYDSSQALHGLQVTSNNYVVPLNSNTYNLGASDKKWLSVYATTFYGNLSGTIASSTTATTQATSDNSTKIATTAWVRTYVDSVAGSNTVGSSVSAYWSNSSNVTAAGTASTNSSTSSMYPACYSEYINKTPVVGTVYSGAQLYTVLNAYASAKGTIQSSGQYNTRITTVTAQATFSNPINPTGKYLCTTANTVKFRAYVTAGNSSTVGSASVVDNSSTKSIFIRIE